MVGGFPKIVGLGFRVLVFRAYGFGFRVYGLGFREGTLI